MVQVDVSRHELEVAIGREHDEAVPDTQLGEERIDRPDLTPRRQQVLRSSAASTWSVRSGTSSGSDAKRSTMASRAVGPRKPCSSSWSTSPVV